MEITLGRNKVNTIPIHGYYTWILCPWDNTSPRYHVRGYEGSGICCPGMIIIRPRDTLYEDTMPGHISAGIPSPRIVEEYVSKVLSVFSLKELSSKSRYRDLKSRSNFYLILKQE
jgi:hypothetical protein